MPFKILLLLVLMMSLYLFVCAEAGRPMLDAANYSNCWAADIVIEKNPDNNGIEINEYSAFAIEFFCSACQSVQVVEPGFPACDSNLMITVTAYPCPFATRVTYETGRRS